jgi:CHAT domain-containing protein
LAISASLVVAGSVERTGAPSQVLAGTVPRGVYDLDAASLSALASANAEAQAVGEIIGRSTSTILLGAAASELAVKRQPLQDYQVLHSAVHGILSTKFPTRSALILRPAGSEDGLLQAGEILTLVCERTSSRSRRATPDQCGPVKTACPAWSDRSRRRRTRSSRTCGRQINSV